MANWEKITLHALYATNKKTIRDRNLTLSHENVKSEKVALE